MCFIAQDVSILMNVPYALEKENIILQLLHCVSKYPLDLKSW